MLRPVILCLLVVASSAAAQSPVSVRIVSDQADAALTIADALRAGDTVFESQWQRLFASEGYRALKAREAYMRRAFTDSSFAAFLRTDSLLARAPALRRSLDAYKSLDATGATARALAYLPRGATIRALLLPMVKPIPNSFVFPVDSVYGIFKYIEPGESTAKVENTLAHELHHIGYATVCRTTPDTTVAPAIATLRVRLLGFGEGLAMLAAAGSADVHPHAVSDSATRARWDRDVAAAARDIRLIEEFAADVLDGRVTSADSVTRRAMTFYGEQGPWYTVGWLMGSTIERAFGRARLLGALCDPVELMSLYNAARPAAGWTPAVLERLRDR